MKKIFTLVAAVLATVSLSAVTYTPDPGENTIQPLIAGLADGDTILLSEGNYTEWNTFDITTKLTIIAEKDAVVNLGIYDLDISNDIEINGVNVNNISADNYLFDVVADVAGKLVFKNCKITHNPSNAITTATPYFHISGFTIGDLIIDNCIFGDNAKSQGAILYAQSSNFTNINITNSTAYNMPNDLAIWCEHATNILVDQCTFYNCGIRCVYFKGGTNYLLQNCIFSNPTAAGGTCVALYAGDVKNIVYFNNNGPRTGGSTNTDCLNADPLFVDAAKADFTLGEGSPALTAGVGGKAVGDPRWIPSGPTALVSAKAAQNSKKIMVNGQMVIVRDGEQYNVLGTKF